jgi:signal transduction histidine kinase
MAHDNGEGFKGTRDGGRGLANMNQRAQQLNARLSVETSEQGTKVRLEIPLTDHCVSTPATAGLPTDLRHSDERKASAIQRTT